MSIEHEVVDNTSDIESLFNMLGIKNSIILNNNIGLIGEFNDKKEHKQYDTFNVPSFNEIKERIADKFRVVDSDGCILFNEYIDKTFKVKEDNDVVGYAFILADFNAIREVDLFFDEDNRCYAVIAYINGKLYCNNITDEKVKNKYDYISNLNIDEVGICRYKMEFNNKIYVSSICNIHNAIYNMNLSRLHI